MKANWAKPIVWGINWARSQDLFFLILLFAIAASLWTFIELADEVGEGETRAIDERIVHMMRNPDNPADAIGPRWFEEGVRDVTALGSVTVVVFLSFSVLGFLAIKKQFHALGLLLGALLGALALNILLKGFFDRARPDLVPHLVHVSQKSFPSGHSLFSTVVYLTLGALLTRLVEPIKLKIYVLTIAAALPFLVGVSRVYLGVHYPTDVLAGWMVGLAWAIACWLVARKLQRRGLLERPNETSAESNGS